MAGVDRTVRVAVVGWCHGLWRDDRSDCFLLYFLRIDINIIVTFKIMDRKEKKALFLSSPQEPRQFHINMFWPLKVSD